MNHIFDGPGGPINPNQFRTIFFAICLNPLGNEPTFEFFSSNFDKILCELPNGEETILYIFEIIANTATDKNLISKVSF